MDEFLPKLQTPTLPEADCCFMLFVFFQIGWTGDTGVKLQHSVASDTKIININ